MPVVMNNGGPTPSVIGRSFLRRALTITDPQGGDHVIRTQEDLDKVLASMTPEQKKQWEDNYRFCKVDNLTGNSNYTGTLLDIG
jgi:hypothetical protein